MKQVLFILISVIIEIIIIYPYLYYISCVSIMKHNILLIVYHLFSFQLVYLSVLYRYHTLTLIYWNILHLYTTKH